MSMLIEPKMLADMIDDKNLLVIDARFSLSDLSAGEKMYQHGHILGAVYANLDSDLSGLIVPEKTGRHPLPSPETFEQTLNGWGVKPESKVVVYDDGSHALAARAWWLLRWAGIKQVSILHGGINAWLACSYPVEIEAIMKTSGSYKFAGTVSDMPIISTTELMAGMDDFRFTMIDSRDQGRFSGEMEPMDSIGGHIPRAICRPFVNNLDKNGRFHSPELLQKEFANIIDQNKTTVFYCGSGVTACHNIFAYEYAGLKGAVLYPGSWSEWIIDPRRPISQGSES